MEIIIIAAMAENRVIGKDNALPWSLKEDMAHFKALTACWPCIMGRKTWESLPNRPLPGRLNVVISRSLTNKDAPDALVLPSLHKAIQYLTGHLKIFICGGAALYEEAMAYATHIELTQIHQSYEGDVLFPHIDPARWIITSTTNHDAYSFISYRKINRFTLD